MGIRRLAFVVALLHAATAGVALAQRQLHWDALDVEARLDADGVLDVVERHTMVFTGDWNGGERVFNIRPRQRLDFDGHGADRRGIGRGAAAATRARARSRSTSSSEDRRSLAMAQPPALRPAVCEHAPRLRPALQADGILLKDEERYRLDHDFAFPDRVGPITRFSLESRARSRLAAVERASASATTPARSHPGEASCSRFRCATREAGSPLAIDGRRPPEIVQAVAAILVCSCWASWCSSYARLGSAASLRSRRPASTRRGSKPHIVAHPAEVVGAAWDGRIGAPEVVALIARMTPEGKLESEATGKDSMTLRLKVDRDTLEGHERALVGGLFFDGRVETSTAAVRQHYKATGFDPAKVIAPDLESRVKDGAAPRQGPCVAAAYHRAGAGRRRAARDDHLCRSRTCAAERSCSRSRAVAWAPLLQIPGRVFRARMDWGPVAAALFMIPALARQSGCRNLPVDDRRHRAARAAVDHDRRDRRRRDLHLERVHQRTEIAAEPRRDCVPQTSRHRDVGSSPRSSRNRIRTCATAGIRGSCRSAWAIGSTPGRRGARAPRRHHLSGSEARAPRRARGSFSSSSGGSGWTGGGGGLSGGAGASGTWAAAAAGIAAGVSSPSSGSSGGGVSSSGGSSGGGGGGGW